MTERKTADLRVYPLVQALMAIDAAITVSALLWAYISYSRSFSWCIAGIIAFTAAMAFRKYFRTSMQIRNRNGNYESGSLKHLSRGLLINFVAGGLMGISGLVLRVSVYGIHQVGAINSLLLLNIIALFIGFFTFFRRPGLKRILVRSSGFEGHELHHLDVLAGKAGITTPDLIVIRR